MSKRLAILFAVQWKLKFLQGHKKNPLNYNDTFNCEILQSLGLKAGMGNSERVDSRETFLENYTM